MRKKIIYLLLAMVMLFVGLSLSTSKPIDAASSYVGKIRMDVKKVEYDADYGEYSPIGDSILDENENSITLNAGDKIAIEFYAYVPDGFRSVQVDFKYDTNYLKRLVEVPYAIDYWGTGARKVISSSMMTNKSVEGSSSISAGVSTVPADVFGRTVRDGAIVETKWGHTVFEVAPTATGAYVFTNYRKVLGDKNGGDALLDSNIEFITPTLNFGGVSDETGFETLTVNNANLAANGALGYKSEPVPAVDKEAKLKALVASGGQIDSVVVDGTTILFNDVDKGYKIPLKGPGQDTIVTIVTRSSSGTATQTYTITIPQTAYNIATLDGLVLNAKNASGAPGAYSQWYNATNTETVSGFQNNGTLNYYYRYSSDVTTIDVIPTVTSGYYITKVSVNGTSVNSAGTISVAKNTDIIVTVTAQNGTTQMTYNIKHYVASNDTGITGVGVQRPGDSTFLPGIWNAANDIFTVTDKVPYSTAHVMLFASTISPRSTIKIGIVTIISSGYKIDFGNVATEITKSIEIVVTSEIGTSKIYTIIVTRTAASSVNTLDTLSIKDVDNYTYTDITNVGDIYTLNTVLKYTIKKLVISVSSLGLNTKITIDGTAVVTGGSKEVIFPIQITSLTKTYAIQITAENGAVKIYSLKIEREAADTNTNVDIQLWSIQNPTKYELQNSGVNQYSCQLPLVSGHTFKLVLTAASDLTKIYVKTTFGGADGNLYNPNTTYNVPCTVYIKAVAESGAILEISIQTTKTDERDSDHSIQSLIVIGYESAFTFTPGQTNYSFTVPYAVESVEIVLVANSRLAIISGAGIKMLPSIGGTVNSFKLSVTAQNESKSPDYYINITRRNGSALNGLDELKVEANGANVDFGFNKTNLTYTFCLGRNISSLNITAVAEPLATFSISNFSSFVNGLNTYTITVLSETKLKKEYKLLIYRASSDFGLNGIRILDQQNGLNLMDSSGAPFTFNPTTYMYTFTVPFTVKKAFVDVTKNDSAFAKSFDDGLKDLTAPGTYTFEIYVKSEYGVLNSAAPNQSSQIYTITIIREAADRENRLKTLVVSIDSVSQAIGFSEDKFSYAIQNIPDDASTVTISGTLKSTKSTVNGFGTFSLSKTPGSTETFKIIITPESGAADIKEYSIIVSRKEIKLDDNNAITGITVTGGGGTVYQITFSPTQTTYEITVPGTENTINFNVSKYSEKAIITGAGILNPLIDGVNPERLIFATSESGVKGQVYKLIIRRTPSSTDNTLKDLKIDGLTVPNFSSSVLNYKINILNTVETISILGVLNDSKALIVSGNQTNKKLEVGSNILSIVVKAENGDIKTYNVEIVRDAPGVLSGLEVEDFDLNPAFDSNVFTYIINVPYSQTTININGILANVAETTITGNGNKNLIVGKNNIEIIVTAKSGKQTKYIVEVNRAKGNADAFLEELFINGATANVFKNQTSYDILLGRGVSVVDFTGIVISTNATYTIAPVKRDLIIGKNQYIITVVSEDKKATKTYTFNLYRADNNKDVNDILLYKEGTTDFLLDSFNNRALVFNPETLTYTFSVRYSIGTFTFKSNLGFVEATGSIANGPVSLKVGENTFEFQVTSEYGKYNPSDANGKGLKYTIVITREPINTDSTLKTLEFKILNVNKLVGFAKNIINYQISDIDGDITSAFILAVPTMDTSTVSGNGNVTLSTGSIEDKVVVSFPIKVTAEDGTSTTYTIMVSRDAIDFSKDNTILNISVLGGDGIYYLEKASFNQETLSYNITIPFGPKSYTINAEKASVSPAVFTGVGQVPITSAMYGLIKEHKIFATSESGVKGIEYTIFVTIARPSTDNALKDLKAEGILITGFAPDKYQYTLNVANIDDFIMITATANDAKSKITGNVGNIALVEGVNNLIITVTAEDGSQKNYTIIVNREYAKPLLKNLQVNGEILLDESGKAVDFNPHTYVYYVKLLYIKFSCDIIATKLNENDNVVGSGQKELPIGKSSFVITVISPNATSTEYLIHIDRRGETSTNTNILQVTIDEVPEFVNDFKNENSMYDGYKVSNKTISLRVTVVLENLNGDEVTEKATYEVYNHTSLKLGKNTIIILVTAADGTTTRPIIVEVERSKMSYEIVENAFGQIKVEKNDERTYKLKVESGKLSDYDFTKYIKTDDVLDIKVLTELNEGAKEIVIQISDGNNTEYVKFVVEGGMFSVGPSSLIYILIACGICASILVVILISVNRDKYGRISKKRKALR